MSSNSTGNSTAYLSSATCPPDSSSFLAQTGLYYIVFVVLASLAGILLFLVSVFYYLWMRRFYQRVLREGAFWDSANSATITNSPPPQHVEQKEKKGVGEYIKAILGIVVGTVFLLIDVFFVAISFLKNLKPFSLKEFLLPLTDATAKISGINTTTTSTTSVSTNSGTAIVFWGSVIGYQIGIFLAAFLWSVITPYVLTWTFRLAYEPDYDIWEKHDTDGKPLSIIKTIFNKLIHLLKKLPQFLCVKVLTFFLSYFSKQILVYCIVLPLFLFWPLGIPVVMMVLCCFTVQGFWICTERVKELLGKRGVNLSRQFGEYVKGIFQKVLERITQGNVNNGSENLGTEITAKLKLLFALIVQGFLPFCYIFLLSMIKHVIKLWLGFPEPQILGVQPAGICRYFMCACLWYKRRVNKEVDELMKTTPASPPANQDPNQFVTVVEGPPPVPVVDPSQPPVPPPSDPSQPQPQPSNTADVPASSSDPAGVDETLKQEFEERQHEMLKYSNMIPMIDWLNFTSSYTLGFMNVIPIIGPFVVLVGTTMIRSGFWLMPFWMFPELYKESDDPTIIPLRKRPQTIAYDFYKKLFFILWEPFDPYAKGGQDSAKPFLTSLKNSSILAERWKTANEYGTIMVSPDRDYGATFRLVMLCVFPLISLFYFPFPCGVDIISEIIQRRLI